eukprot:TRINITY_DN1304_c0_g1_i1.p1 TRINITY_DN1304_c0_g1~~TRINITY_DN1304_c0_g1_i1.p1  ORF type:complete len:221 (+),score=35.98 TRINITY_DN1304_c0_g1_i1:83-745(+)
MPKSKRAKLVSLTKTDRKGLETKSELVEQIQTCLSEYDRVYTFSVENMRNSKLKDVRMAWRDSRFFFGKNKVMARAFGYGPEDEFAPNSHKVSQHLKGNVGVLFTNRDHDKVVEWFGEFAELDYARSGNPATETVEIPAGPLPDFSHTMEPQLRQLGMPTSLKRGVVTMDDQYRICRKGDTLTPEQARMLKLFAKPMATFQIVLMTVFEDGKLKELVQEE